MKKITLITAAIFAYCILVTASCFSQGTAINNNGSAADNSAIIDVSSTSKGALIPRMTTGQRNSIASPADALLIYNTTTQCFEAYNANISQWVSFGCIGCILPGAFSASAASALAQTSFSANWTASSGATTYYLDVATDAAFTGFVPGYNNLNAGGVTTCSVTGLTCNTTYYYRIRSSNSCGTSANSNTVSVNTSDCFTCGTSTIQDYDGNTYNTINIGSQCWLKENLKTTHYRGGTAITKVTGNSAWAALTTEAFCWYNNDSVTYSSVYGALYNWHAVNHTTSGSNDLCPTDWHVPSDAEWCTLENTAESGTDPGCNITGSRGISTGGHLKETGFSHWISPNTGADNTSNFTALPGGYRHFSDGSFDYVGYYGFWWSATEYAPSYAWGRYLSYTTTVAYRHEYDKKLGFSIRCIKN